MKERIPQKTLQVSSKKADAILLSVAVIWGWGFIAGKIALETASPQWILFFRFSIAAICILALFFKQIKNADKACVRWGILIGLLQFAALLFSSLPCNIQPQQSNHFLRPLMCCLHRLRRESSTAKRFCRKIILPRSLLLRELLF